MTTRTLRRTTFATLAFLVSTLLLMAYASPAQDREPTVDDIRAALAAIKADAVRAGSLTRSSEVRAISERTWARADVLERWLRASRPPPVTEPPVRPPPVDPRPPSATPWVNPSTLVLGPLTPYLGTPAPEWGPMLDQYPAVLSNVEISAQAKGSPVIPCKVEGAHQGKLVWRYVRVRGAPAPDGKPVARWDWRAFDVYGFEVADAEFRDIHDEHGCYWNTVGGFAVRRCLFQAMGGQAIQIAGAKPGTARAGETGLGANWQATVDAKRWEWQVVEDSAAIECGYNPARASYALSFFGDVPNPVRIQRCLVQTTTAFHPDTSGAICDSYGAVMAHERLRFELLESGLLYEKGDRDTLQLWGVGDGDPSTVDIRLRGSQIQGRGVDIRMASASACQVVIEGCWGTAPVTISTAPWSIGGSTPPVQSGQVIFKGSMAQGYASPVGAKP